MAEVITLFIFADLFFYHELWTDYF